MGARTVCGAAAGVAVLLISLGGCGQPYEEIDDVAESLDSTSQALEGPCGWDPQFGNHLSTQGDWWFEFSVHDTTTTALQVEITGTPNRTVSLRTRLDLRDGYVKFSGDPGGPVHAGTLLRLKATQGTTGRTATSGWFGYRVVLPSVTCQVCTPSCGSNQCGSNGCGGACGSCASGSTCRAGRCVTGGSCVAAWDPSWTQGDGPGEWWAVFKVAGGGTLTKSVSVEVVGRAGTYPLRFGTGRWSGGVVNVARGTSIILHATNALGATSQTLPFRYLVDTTAFTNQCRGTPRTSTCQPLSRGLVSITIDDSGGSQPTIAVPLLTKYGLKATFFHVPNFLNWTPIARTLAAQGHETGAHTMTHRSITALSAQELDNELRLSKQWLETNVSSPVESFASPSGAFNAASITAIKRYYSSHRTTRPGMNYVGSDVYLLNTDFVLNTSTAAGVCAQIREAAALKGWLVLTFHDFTNGTPTQGFTMRGSTFDAILACAKNTPGVDVVTMKQGVAAIRCGSPQR